MNGRYLPFGTSGNPLAQILSLVVFGVLLVGALIMGAFVLLALLGVAFIGFLAFSIRVWWLRRKHGGRGPSGPSGGGPGGPAKGMRYIEGEYEIVNSDADPDSDAERGRAREQR
jgi:hypothetical protein